MLDKSEQFIGKDDWRFSREFVEQFYKSAEMTDEKWEALVDWCSNCKTKEEFNEDFMEAIYRLDEIIEFTKVYREIWLEENGNPYPFDKDGNNTQETR
jgi:uncharacterized protein YgfB (UPF0149 family)